MTTIQHRTIETNGISMHIAEAGSGPLVVLCHGFPESWYSWRHQIIALAEAGFHAVAPDQRGYGQTEAPDPIEAYTQLHLVGDIVGLVKALGESTAVVAGHDWGAPVAWNCALLRPDIFRGVIGLSVPVSQLPTTAQLKAAFGEQFFYILYFQQPGPAEHELRRDVRKTMRMLLYSASGNPPERTPAPLPKTAGFLDAMVEPEALPPWLTQEDLDFFTAEFERTGFRGGLNWYRNIDRNAQLLAPFEDVLIEQQALFITGDRDLTRGNPNFADQMRARVPNLREIVSLPGIGHWTQQEAPEATNEAMVGFVRSLE